MESRLRSLVSRRRFIAARAGQLAAPLTNFIDGPLSPLKVLDLRPGGAIFADMPRFVSAYSLPIFNWHSGAFYEKRLGDVKRGNGWQAAPVTLA
jgi:hypothetical protein